MPAHTERLSRLPARGDAPTALLALGELLRGEVAVDVLLKRIVDVVAKAMSADRATLFLVDHESGELYSKEAHLPELEEIRLPIGKGIAGQVAATGDTIWSSDAKTDNRFADQVDESTGYVTRDLLAVPVHEHDRLGQQSSRIVGVLEVLNKQAQGSFGPHDAELLRNLAVQVSEALSIAHLDGGRVGPQRFNRIVGVSPQMHAVYSVIENAAGTDATVLVLGESGTGKELIARAIHANSKRAQGPFVKVDCTAIPEGLIEAELFGHEKGAFTGAERLVYGKCELADRGTLFLDEIGDMPLTLQAKLLRFIQDREIERVGGREVLKVDARVVAATNRDLSLAVREGRFRQDLFYRIKVVQVELPPLRLRGHTDIELLAGHFLTMYSRKHDKPANAFDPAALRIMSCYTWPGNIRELEHCVESAIVLCKGKTITPAHLSLPQQETAGDWEESLSQASVPSGLSLEDVEKRYILRTLTECQGNRTRAASVLGIGRNTLVRKLKRYGIT